MDHLVDKELARWLHSKNSGQWVDVQVESSDEWCLFLCMALFLHIALFNIFVSNMGSGNKCTLRKLADKKQLCDAVNIQERKGCHPERQ